MTVDRGMGSLVVPGDDELLSRGSEQAGRTAVPPAEGDPQA